MRGLPSIRTWIAGLALKKRGGGALWKVLDVITTEVSGAALRTHHAVQSLNKKKKKEVTDCLL
jgi:hypothetical protein